MTDNRPDPLVPPNVDLRDAVIPIEFFAQLAAAHYGVGIEEARAHASNIAKSMARKARKQRRRS